MHRRQSRDREKFDQERNLTVAVRVRPMNARELAYVGTTDVVKANRQEIVIRSNQCGGQNNLDHIFQYDHVFWSCNEENPQFASQTDVFECMGKPLLDSAFRGYNACLFAYGQTGSGKSFSMMGPNSPEVFDIDMNAGIIPRFCKELFRRITELPEGSTSSVEVSYYEIYNEKIHDLLACKNKQRMALKVREHPDWGPYIVDLSVHTVTSYKELRSWLVVGNNNRATAATAMNEKSSRSHSIFSIEVTMADGTSELDSSRRSKISLVDLAGSERISNAMNNDERIRQGVSINKSLLTLGKVIAALAESKKQHQHVPYRDSVLTWLLRESLGGNSLTSMLATITPSSSNIEETLATLRYACQARSIVNRARINESLHDKLIRELRAEVERLRALKQDYERNSFTNSMINLSNNSEYEAELDELRNKLNETEGKLDMAEKSWQQRYNETREKQLRELAEAEKRKEELESHLRVMKIDTQVSLSPYQSNFLKELEGIVNAGVPTKQEEKKMTHVEVTSAISNIFDNMNLLRPTVDELDDNVKLLFARINKLLQSFETSLKNTLNDPGSKKTVTFKL